MLTRQDVENLKVGTVIIECWDTIRGIPVPGAKWSDPCPITRIYAKGVNREGQAYVLGYRKFSDNATISFDAHEGEDRIRIHSK